MANSGDIELSQLRFDLHALDRVIVVDVPKLHGQHAGEFVLVGHQSKQAFADVHGPAGKREGVRQVWSGRTVNEGRCAWSAMSAPTRRTCFSSLGSPAVSGRVSLA